MLEIEMRGIFFFLNDESNKYKEWKELIDYWLF